MYYISFTEDSSSIKNSEQMIALKTSIYLGAYIVVMAWIRVEQKINDLSATDLLSFVKYVCYTLLTIFNYISSAILFDRLFSVLAILLYTISLCFLYSHKNGQTYDLQSKALIYCLVTYQYQNIRKKFKYTLVSILGFCI